MFDSCRWIKITFLCALFAGMPALFYALVSPCIIFCSIRGDVGGGSSSGRLGATSPLPQQTKHSSAGGNTGGGDANEDALAQYYAAPALTQSRSPSKLGGMAVAHDLQPGPLNLAYRVRQGPASATGRSRKQPQQQRALQWRLGSAFA